MNGTQKRAIQSAISNVIDNIARAKHQKQADPEWKTGNNESIDQYIAGCYKQLAELSEGMRMEDWQSTSTELSEGMSQ